MRLTKELADKYASYRTRYLFGTQGVYFPEPQPDSCENMPGVIRQEQNEPVPFLRHVELPPTEYGTFLNVDLLPVSDPDDPESGTITDIKHSDNLIYCSFAAIDFAAEYSVTLWEEPLKLCLNIVKSFQRLGIHQQGFNETSPPHGPHGFMLRADSPDEGNTKENICVWKTNPDKARDLEPSYDQYCALLSSLCIVGKIMDQTPVVEEHRQLRQQLQDAISERVLRSVFYLGGSFWTILWHNKSGDFRTASRGAFCIHAAYPFAKIGAEILAKDIADFFTKDFPLTSIPGFNETAVYEGFRNAFHDGVTKFISDQLPSQLIGKLVDHVLDAVIGNSLGEVVKFMDGLDKVKGVIEDVLRAISEVTDLISNLVGELIEAVLQWVGFAIGVAALPLSKLMHYYYSRYMLQDFSEAFFMELAELLNLMGIKTPPNPKFEFKFKYEFKVVGKPPWWPPGLEWKDWKVGFDESVSVEIPIDFLWKLPVPIGILDRLALIVTGVAGAMKIKPDLQTLIFINNVAADTFAENLINPVDTSFRCQNSFMMALTYRMFPIFFEGSGNEDNRNRFRAVMDHLRTAPDTFPDNRLETGPWNQNFRWMRGRKTDNPSDRAVFSGMDFMVPLMLAASHPGDVDFNREILIEALAPKSKEEDSMGVFRLPFQGPYTGDQIIFSPKAQGTQSAKNINIGVVFERGRGAGEVKLHFHDLGGSAQEETFTPEKPARMITIPVTDKEVTAEINVKMKGYFLVELAE